MAEQPQQGQQQGEIEKRRHPEDAHLRQHRLRHREEQPQQQQLAHHRRQAETQVEDAEAAPDAPGQEDVDDQRASYNFV